MCYATQKMGHPTCRRPYLRPPPTFSDLHLRNQGKNPLRKTQKMTLYQNGRLSNDPLYSQYVSSSSSSSLKKYVAWRYVLHTPKCSAKLSTYGPRTENRHPGYYGKRQSRISQLSIRNIGNLKLVPKMLDRLQCTAG